MVLLAGASEQLCRVLPSSPPAQYTGTQQTAAVRAALQNALDSGYVPKTEHLPLNVGHSDGETRSFGETHASELSTITTVTDNGHDDATPINPAALNNNPALIPVTTTHYSAPTTGPPAHHYAAPSVAPPSLPHGPTVAETGIPITAGSEGPGPVAGIIHPTPGEVRDRPAVGYGVGVNEQAPAYEGALSSAPHESAADEKRRLAAAEQTQTTTPASYASLNAPSGGHQGGLVASTSTRRPATHESVEDEKKRLEREERERILHQGTTTRGNTQDDGTDPSGGAAPPAYND